MTLSLFSAPARIGAALLVAAALAACSMGGGGGGGGLAPGLVANMDVPGARLDRAQALGLINQYRATAGIAPLAADTGLDGSAQQLATQYAQTGNAPRTPPGVVAMRLSAGYGNFANTFSGWRNSPEDARVLLDGRATRAGLAVAANPNSAYGVHWVLLLAQ
ncbi:CAP domain-containing protein [Arsenicitalea aurantiaca]|nr:CAP domain-containing protein [Arsenicitalea aurantiaca]